MQRYYKTLDIQPGATLDQVKSQYRQLVRIYHPDRFGNDGDRQYAEEKLKEINEAYSAIVRVRKQPSFAASDTQSWVIEEDPTDAPGLVLQPAHIDFGEITRGETVSRRFTIFGDAAHFQNLKFAFSEPNAFFSIEKRRPLYADQALPAEIQLKLNTSKLEPELIHGGWIEAKLNGDTAKLSFSAYVKPISILGLSPRWATVALVILLLLSVAVAGPLMPQLRGFWPITTTSASYQPSPNQIVFAANQSGGSRLFAISPNGTAQQPLALAGHAPVWSPTGEQMVYLSLDSGLEQLHLSDAESAEKRLLTQSTLRASTPVWSADGTQIAYVASSDQQDLVQLLSLAQQAPRTVFEAEAGQITHIDWLPAAEGLLVELQTDGRRTIQRVQVGSQPQPFTQQQSNGFDVNPQSGQIALATAEGILLLNDEGILLDQLPTFDADAQLPKWSTDGLSLAFLSNDGSTANLWVTDADGSGLTRLTTMGCLDYFWSPDDRYIAYITGNADSESPILFLWVVEVSNGQSTLVAEISEPHVTWAR